MDNNLWQTERLISFIDGDLNETEKELLQKELATNKAMQEELDNLLLTKEAVKNYGLTNRVAGIHKNMMSQLAPVKQKSTVRSLPKLMLKYAAAVILLAGTFGLYQLLTVSANKLYTEQYNKYSVSTFRGSETSSAIEKAYAAGNYDEAIADFKQLSNASINENFIAGQAFLAKQDYVAAIVCFKQALEKNAIAHTGLLVDDTEYYLALAYLKNNQINEAIPLFKNIHDTKTHAYHDKVSSWYVKQLELLKWKQE